MAALNEVRTRLIDRGTLYNAIFLTLCHAYTGAAQNAVLLV